MQRPQRPVGLGHSHPPGCPLTCGSSIGTCVSAEGPGSPQQATLEALLVALRETLPKDSRLVGAQEAGTQRLHSLKPRPATGLETSVSGHKGRCGPCHQLAAKKSAWHPRERGWQNSWVLGVRDSTGGAFSKLWGHVSGGR